LAEVLVVGPGAMGQMHAGLMARAGLDVALLHHDAGRAEELARRGVRLRLADDEAVVPVACSADAARLGPARHIFLLTKAYSTGAAAEGALPAAGAGTVWATLQNGLGNAEAIVAAAPVAPALVGVTASAAHVLADGSVRVVAVGPATVGPTATASLAQAEAFAQLMASAGLTCEAVADPWPAVWRKLVVNAAINATAALAGRPNGDLLELPWLRAVAEELARETWRVGMALGVDLSGCDPAALVAEVCRATAANRNSMLQDLEAGRRTEVDEINGAVAARAPAEAPAPLCAAIAALVRCAERRRA
jgi:2-dehydropantoate 2-reductase